MNLRCPCCGWLWPDQDTFDDHAAYMQKFGMWPEGVDKGEGPTKKRHPLREEEDMIYRHKTDQDAVRFDGRLGRNSSEACTTEGCPQPTEWACRIAPGGSGTLFFCPQHFRMLVQAQVTPMEADLAKAESTAHSLKEEIEALKSLLFEIDYGPVEFDHRTVQA